MFKAWHVFAASLVFLALVLTGATIGSMNGIDSRLETFPTQPPAPENNAPPPTAQPGVTQLQLASPSQQGFDKNALTAPAGQPVQLIFNNPENGVPHNFALYTNRSASQVIFQGELVTGPATFTYEFNAPQAGTYFFRCDVHPNMTGSFTSS